MERCGALQLACTVSRDGSLSVGSLESDAASLLE